MVVVDIDNPLQPKVTAEIGPPALLEPRGIAIQFRYAFVVDREGLKVLDVTALDQPKPLPGGAGGDRRCAESLRGTHVCLRRGRTKGLAIVDVEHPESPKLDQIFNAGGRLQDSNDVKLGMVSSSLFAYVADGKNGLQVVQLFSPVDNPAFSGFLSARPTPKWIARYRTRGAALAVSRGIDRDRAVDESGNQLAVFGRRGARPFNRAEMERMYLRDGQLFTVTDDPPAAPGAQRGRRTTMRVFELVD